MTTSKDLFLSILAMDAYNRGYGAGIADEGEHDPDGLGGIGSIVGSAKVVLESDVDEGTPGVDASFYAIAYKVGPDGPADLVGKTVISYRGTDDATDYLTGWRVGASRTGSPVPRCGYGR